LDLQKLAPIMLYDNKCYLCAKFAAMVDLLARGNICLVGHYTEIGQRLREQILDSSALDMFWFIDRKTAYGGRAALLPLFSAIIANKTRAPCNKVDLDACGDGCRTAKAVFVRSASLFTHSKKISIT
jgi:predicted DCC family thiol-disulfide oxidoreductase YuxK